MKKHLKKLKKNYLKKPLNKGYKGEFEKNKKFNVPRKDTKKLTCSNTNKSS